MVYIQIIRLFHASQNHAVRLRSGNDICIFVSITEVHGVAIVGLEEYILASFGETLVVSNVAEELASPTACIDEDLGFREHVVQFLQGLDALLDELASELGDLLLQVRYVECGIGDEGFVGPTAAEVGWIFALL